MSYYSERTVINLDGIVNRDAYMAIKDKRMAAYVRSLHLDYLTDWQIMIDGLLQNASRTPLEESEITQVYSGYFKVYRFNRQR